METKTVTEPMIERLYQELQAESLLPYSASVRDFTLGDGTTDLVGLQRADEDAEQRNRQWCQGLLERVHNETDVTRKQDCEDQAFIFHAESGGDLECSCGLHQRRVHNETTPASGDAR